MGFSVFLILAISHISVFISCFETEQLLDSEPVIFSEEGNVQRILVGNIDGITATHKHSGYDPMELLIKSEFMLLTGISLRVELLMESYMSIVDGCKMEGEVVKEFEKTGLATDEYSKNIEKVVNEMVGKLKEIHMKYDKEDFKLPYREPSSFMSLELIKSGYKMVEEIYKIILKIIKTSKIDDEMKRKYISTLDNKTALFLFSGKILFLKMIYDIGYARKLRMRFILPGIYYLLVFESGICKRILEDKMIEEMEFFNGFLDNYKGSAEELIERVLFHIKEDELPMEANETLHSDLMIRHKDFNEIVDSLISTNGPIFKETKG